MIYQRRAEEQGLHEEGDKLSETSEFSKSFGMSISCMPRCAHAMQRQVGDFCTRGIYKFPRITREKVKRAARAYMHERMLNRKTEVLV